MTTTLAQLLESLDISEVRDLREVERQRAKDLSSPFKPIDEIADGEYLESDVMYFDGPDGSEIAIRKHAEFFEFTVTNADGVVVGTTNVERE